MVSASLGTGVIVSLYLPHPTHSPSVSWTKMFKSAMKILLAPGWCHCNVGSSRMRVVNYQVNSRVAGGYHLFFVYCCFPVLPVWKTIIKRTVTRDI